MGYDDVFKIKIEEPETVASHMYRMAVLAMTLQDCDCDVVKCIKMALVHDIAEAIVGDITPHCGVSDEQKFNLEHKAFLEISTYVSEKIGDEWVSLWREYEENKSKEANIVKHLDKFDMIAQAFSYEKRFNIGAFI
ncbi:unnamed protein product [Anisakis simplex]|uniref:5'-deoxynucleotidase HDDC2 n=1 Tax=Anisakis simplex TaxID=6269 RepID=A0A0M3JXI0_ANISI|nr:unnamed protein product [Anisakis simplex]